MLLILISITILMYFLNKNIFINSILLISIFFFSKYKNIIFLIIYFWALSWILLKHLHWFFLEIYRYITYFFIIGIKFIIFFFKKWF